MNVIVQSEWRSLYLYLVSFVKHIDLSENMLLAIPRRVTEYYVFEWLNLLQTSLYADWTDHIMVSKDFTALYEYNRIYVYSVQHRK